MRRLASSLVLLVVTLLLLSTTHQEVTGAPATTVAPNITRLANITTLFNEGIYNGAILFAGRLFLATYSMPGRIVQIGVEDPNDSNNPSSSNNKNFLSREDMLITPGVGYYGNGIEICGFGYFPAQMNPGMFSKIDLTAGRFKLVATGTGSKDLGDFSFVAPLTYNDLIFFGTKNTPARVVSFSLGNLLRIRHVTLPSAIVNGAVSQGRVAFYALEGSSNGALVKFDLHTMTVIEYFSNSSMCCFQSISASFPYGTFPSSPDALSPFSAASHANGRAFLLVGTGSVPGNVYKFHVTGPGTNSISLTEDAPNRPFWLVDSAIVGDYAFLLQTSSPGLLYRTNSTANYSFGDDMINATGATGEDFNVFVTDGTFGYVATNSNPGIVIKYDLGLSSAAFNPNVPGQKNDTFGKLTLDLNRTLCVDRGTYAGRNVSLRLAPDTNLLEARFAGSEVWGAVSSNRFSASTATALCRILGYDVTWAAWFRVQSNSNNNNNYLESLSSLLVSNDIVPTIAEARTLARENATLFLSLLKFPFYIDDLECKWDALELGLCKGRSATLSNSPTVGEVIPLLTDAAPNEAVGLNCTVQANTTRRDSNNRLISDSNATSSTAKSGRDGVYSAGWHFRLARNGRLDVRPAGSNPDTAWGTACSKGMNRFGATGLCRILGYPHGVGYLVHFVRGSGNFVTDNTSIYMTGVQCPATLRSFADCRYLSGRSTQACTHADDLGLLCNGTREEGTYVGNGKMLRLSEENRLEVRDYKHSYNEEDNALPIEDRGWATVRHHAAFTTTTAAAVCSMLGFNVSSYASFFVNDSSSSSAASSSSSSNTSTKVAMTGLECFSKDTRFFGFCVYSTVGFDVNAHDSDLGLLCNAEVRGVRSGDYMVRTRADNLLQVRPAVDYYSTTTTTMSSHNATHWGTVCGDSGFSAAEEGASFCRILGNWGSSVSASTVTSNIHGVAAGDVLMSNISCNSTAYAAPISKQSEILFSCWFDTEKDMMMSSNSNESQACLAHKQDVLLNCDAGSDSSIDAGAVAGFVIAAVAGVAIATGLFVWLFCIVGGRSKDDDDDADEVVVAPVLVSDGESDNDDDDAQELKKMERRSLSPSSASRPPPPARDETIARSHYPADAIGGGMVSPPRERFANINTGNSYVFRIGAVTDPVSGNVVSRQWYPDARPLPALVSPGEEDDDANNVDERQLQDAAELHHRFEQSGRGGAMSSSGIEHPGMIRIINENSRYNQQQQQPQQQQPQQENSRIFTAASPSPGGRYSQQYQHQQHHPRIFSPPK